LSSMSERLLVCELLPLSRCDFREGRLLALLKGLDNADELVLALLGYNCIVAAELLEFEDIRVGAFQGHVALLITGFQLRDFGLVLRNCRLELRDLQTELSAVGVHWRSGLLDQLPQLSDER
jgi:hypothetical protein